VPVSGANFDFFLNVSIKARYCNIAQQAGSNKCAARADRPVQSQLESASGVPKPSGLRGGGFYE